MDKKKEIKVALIGCGDRALHVVSLLQQVSDQNITVETIYDPNPARYQEATERFSGAYPKKCSSYQEAIVAPGIEWVMIFSPNRFHKEQILFAFAEGKHVFAEKPLATSIADCREICDAALHSSSFFATGFVLRYAPIYRKAKALLDSGKYGKVISIDANENISVAHGSFIMTDWRRHKEIAGPYILEKCCHDLDLFCWFTASLPRKVASFGSLDYFNSDNLELYRQFNSKIYEGWYNYKSSVNAFESDKSIMDNQVVVMEFFNKAKATFQLTMNNILPERRIFMVCTKGNIRLDLYTGKLEARSFEDGEIMQFDFHSDLHGGGDEVIMRELYEKTILQKETPKCGGIEGLQSAVIALSIDEAASIGKIVDLTATWRNIGIIEREKDSQSQYIWQ